MERKLRERSAVQRLRAETTVTLKWIAAELHMVTWTHVANRLHHAKNQTEPENQVNSNCYTDTFLSPSRSNG